VSASQASGVVSFALDLGRAAAGPASMGRSPVPSPLIEPGDIGTAKHRPGGAPAPVAAPDTISFFRKERLAVDDQHAVHARTASRLEGSP